MPFKFEIAQGKKVCHFEGEAESLSGKKLGDSVSGTEISDQFSGYEFQITGASDTSGFPALAQLDGTSVKRLLLKKGKGMKTKGGGFRKRKSIHGNTIDSRIIQINLKVIKAGGKSIAAILGKEDKPKEAAAAPAAEAAPAAQ